MHDEKNLARQAQRLIDKLKHQQLTLSSAESCTGGGFGYYITSVSGASEVYRGGCITYTLETKQSLLAISSILLEQYGVYSVECACAMAQGVQRATVSDIGVSFTGVADSTPDQACAPGTVFMGIATGKEVFAEEYHFLGNRMAVRSQAIMQGMKLVEKLLDGILS